MFNKGYCLLLLLFAFLIVSCSPEQSEIVVATYGNKEVTMKEFQDAYAKSAGGYEIAKNDSLSRWKNFLDLYVNFKMKLRDAEVRGFAGDSALQAELVDYKKRVGVTYLIEKEIIEPGIRTLYERRKTELRVSHIMIRQDSTGEEAARKLTQSILDSIKAGKSFEEMAGKYSHDKYSSPIGGDIYYVTAGLLPLEFENAMYNTEVGKVYPEVVQTRYGFHLIKVTEKQARIPQIRASHILVNFLNEAGEVDSLNSRARIDSVADMIKAGVSFDSLAMQYSDDGSKRQGGDLGYFERRNMVKEFDEAAFKLNPGEVSGIIRTQYGYHIIKVTDKKAYPSFEEDKENLKKLFKQTGYQPRYDAFVDSLKKAGSFTADNDILAVIAASNDTIKVGGEYNNIDNIKNNPVFSYAGKNLTVSSFLEKLNQQQEFINKPVTFELLKNAGQKVGSDFMLEEAALSLDKTNPQFASLMEDYKNGIYIFKLQEDEVWNKINLDSTKLYQHYLDTKDNYVWPDRVGYSEIFSKKDSLINYFYTLLQQGAGFDSLAAKYTERPGFKEKAGYYGLSDPKASVLAQEAAKLQNPGDYSKPIKVTGGFSIIKLTANDPSHLKNFEEAKAEVSSSLQEKESKRLEQVYVDSLKKKYTPVLNYDALEMAFPKDAEGQTSMENSDKASK